MEKTKQKIFGLPGIALLSIGFLTSVIIGTILLMLPISSADGTSTNFVDSLFVATSASCVTGLVPFDTGLHWSTFGKVVIITLIQIGGLGFMTLITLVTYFIKRNVSLYSQTVLMQSAGTYSIGGVLPLLKKIMIGTAVFEGLGAFLLTLCLWGKFGAKAIGYGIFTSISAFCNAGFDIFGSTGGSLTDYVSNVPVLLILSALILIGGAGFIVWSDIWETRFRFKRMQLHTKIVLVVTLFLTVIPALLFFVFEFTPFGNGGHFASLSVKEKLINSLFLAISPRTAGFNAINLAELSAPGKLLTIVLMFIGGNSGSTAGGVKVTTVVVIVANLVASAQGKSEVKMFNQCFPNRIIRQASALFNSYIIIIVVSTILISAIEPFALDQVLFETTSAIATVGLTLGITSSLTVYSKLIIIILMYFGRLGAFTLFDLLFRNNQTNSLKYPEGRLLVG